MPLTRRTKPRTSRRRVARARAVLTRTILRGEEIETNDARDDVARAVRSDVGRARASPHTSSVGAAAAAAAAIACRDGARVRVSKRPSAARARERRSNRRVTHAVALHTCGYVGRARASLRTPSRASSVAAAAAAAATATARCDRACVPESDDQEPASATRVKEKRSKQMTRAMMPRAPRTVTSAVRARHRARHQSALPPPPPPPQPPPPRLACNALRALGGIA